MDAAGQEATLERRKQIARRLLELYTITAGLALASGLEKAFASDGPKPLLEGCRLLLLGAFLLTLVPFFHGALAWLDTEWLASLNTLTNGRMVIDFISLFLQLCFLFVLGKCLASPTWFGWVYCCLLFLDVIWATLAIWRRWESHIAPGGAVKRTLGRELTAIREGAAGWLWVNLGALVIAIPTTLFISHRASQLIAAASIAVVAVARTAVDYSISWKFYFPTP